MLVEVPLWLASMVPLSPLIAAGLLLILARAVARAARPWAWTPRVLRGPTGATTP